MTGSKHLPLPSKVQINLLPIHPLQEPASCNRNPGADPITPMNVFSMSLYNLPDRVPCKVRVLFAQKQFLGGIYLHKKCLGTSRMLVLPFLMVIPLCLNAPDFQLSIRNCRPSWLSKLFYIICVPMVFFPRPLIFTVLVTLYIQ